jgi:hypothetical protein
MNDDPDSAAKKIVGEPKGLQTSQKRRNKDKEKEKERGNKKPLPVLPTYKYSRPFLHEAIILGGVPRFISYAPKFDMIISFEDIKDPSRILRPPNREEYPYLPYEFADEQELAEYLRCAKLETKDSLLGKAKSIARKYNDQDNPILNLLAIDIFWSYFQDKFGTTHYLDIVGDNDTGKSSLGNTYEAVGYRAVNMTSPTAPNVFRTLGTIEPGQCTLVLDEADKIDESVDMMNILKAGYDYNKKVPKTNTNAWKVEWFYAYCLKIIIAEKSLSRFKAKGLLDRALSINTVPGEPELDIKEVTNPQGDQKLEEALNELLDLRKLMLIFRIVHFEDCIVDLDIGIKSRNRELCKPYLRLFYGTDAQEEIEQTFQTFIESKNSKKGRSIEAILVPVIINLVEEKGVQVSTSETWEFINANLDGEPYGPDEYRTSDFTLYRNTITKTLEDKFGAEYKHTNKGGSLTFKLDKLQRLYGSYNADIKIKSKLKSDSSDSSDGSKNKTTTLECPKPQETIEISQDSTADNVNFSQNRLSKVLQTPQSLSQEPSLPSLPSPIESSNVDDKDKAAMLRQYDRLSALARKKSTAATHFGADDNDFS